MPKPERLEIRKMLSNVKTRVNLETTAIGQIYTEEIARANLSTTALAIANTAKEASTYKLSILQVKFDNFILYIMAYIKYVDKTHPLFQLLWILTFRHVIKKNSWW
jgi:hypothetical protein